jgi:septal ring factor EnvC (AmiA/AmiB activator)
LNTKLIAIDAVEPGTLVQILGASLLLALIAAVTLAILHLRLRLTVRADRRGAEQLTRSVAAKSDEIERLEARIADYVQLEEGVEELKNEVRRADAIRGKTEERLRVQNDEIAQIRKEAVERMAELERLRKIVEHVDDL